MSPTARSGNGPLSHKELRKGKRSKSEDRKQKRGSEGTDPDT